MALTPEDVVNKRFNPTKFREGYDQDEVDDFLDEVVVELRRLNQDNEELRQRLVASEARINELGRGGASLAPAVGYASEPAPVVPEPVAAEPVVEPEPVAPEPEPVPVAEVVPEPVVAAPAPVEAVPTAEHDTSSTNNLLQLARRLHEEHVREGIERRDALIAEGHATAARVVSEAEAQQAAQLGALEARKAELETSIEDLQVFEREYRANLKDYISGQLRDLETSHAISEGSTPPPTGSPEVPADEAFPTTGDFAAASASTGSSDSASADRPGFAGND